MYDWRDGLFIGLLVAIFIGVVVGSAVVGNSVREERTDQYTQEGYRAGLSGVPAESCPYSPSSFYGSTGEDRRDWMKGWQQGHLERQEAEKRRKSPN